MHIISKSLKVLFMLFICSSRSKRTFEGYSLFSSFGRLTLLLIGKYTQNADLVIQEVCWFYVMVANGKLALWSGLMSKCSVCAH